HRANLHAGSSKVAARSEKRQASGTDARIPRHHPRSIRLLGVNVLRTRRLSRFPQCDLDYSAVYYRLEMSCRRPPVPKLPAPVKQARGPVTLLTLSGSYVLVVIVHDTNRKPLGPAQCVLPGVNLS